jgi:hypothetical protein
MLCCVRGGLLDNISDAGCMLLRAWLLLKMQEKKLLILSSLFLVTCNLYAFGALVCSALFFPDPRQILS